MQKQNTKTIRLFKILAPVISSREIITEILEKKISAENAQTIILDFSDIKFISRSAAHEFLLLKERFNNKRSYKKTIDFINMENSVAEMIRIVAANRAYPSTQEVTFKVKKMNILELV